MYKSLKLRRPPVEDDLKISKGEYLSNNGMDHDSWVLRGNLEENLEKNSEEILIVALLSPACLQILFSMSTMSTVYTMSTLSTMSNKNMWKTNMLWDKQTMTHLLSDRIQLYVLYIVQRKG